MSADNGIYVLSTLSNSGSREFRVSHAQAIENIEEPEPYDSYYMHALFNDSPIFSSKDEAFTYAFQMYNDAIKSFGIVEYGVCLISLERKFPTTEEGTLPEESSFR